VIRRPAATAALVLALAFGGAGCGQKGKDAENVIRRRLEGEPATLNPILATTDMENVVLALVERNLLDYDEHLDLVPGLADSVTVSPDARSYTVRLREGARWEDGSPVTSDDVAYTLRTLADPKTPALSRKSFWEGLERVDVVDARTARVVFRTPYSGRIHAFNVGLLPATEYRGTDVASNPRNRRPLANGPYRLAAWEAGRLELVRNTQYFGPKAGPERVVFRVVPESAPAFEALLSGELHEMRLSSEQKKRLDGASPPAAARAIVFDELMYTYIGWNNSNPLFASPKVRRALTMLIDRETIARTLYGGLAKPAAGPVPPGLFTFDPELRPWPYDPEAAGALLDEAGFRKGADGVRARGKERLSFTLLLGAGSDLQRQITEVIQQSYRKAGIEMAIRPLEWAAFASKVDAGDFEASILALSLDPNPDLYPFWHSSQKAPNGWNTVGYRNPAADAVMDEIRVTFDREKTLALYKELQRLIHEDEPVTFLHVGSRRWGLNRRLENVRTSPYGLFLFWPGGSAWRMGRGLGPV
jgi:peptide/nickel transport system substrate-binding protein